MSRHGTSPSPMSTSCHSPSGFRRASFMWTCLTRGPMRRHVSSIDSPLRNGWCTSQTAPTQGLSIGSRRAGDFLTATEGVMGFQQNDDLMLRRRASAAARMPSVTQAMDWSSDWPSATSPPNVRTMGAPSCAANWMLRFSSSWLCARSFGSGEVKRVERPRAMMSMPVARQTRPDVGDSVVGQRGGDCLTVKDADFEGGVPIAGGLFRRGARSPVRAAESAEGEWIAGRHGDGS